MNETLKTIAGRFSCRSFTGEALTDEQLRAITNAALAAPSAMNRQPWHVAAVTNKSLISEIEAEGMSVLCSAEDKSAYNRIMSRGGKMFYNAPCMLVISVDSSEYALMDCGILAQNVVLAAASLGLGSVICAMARFAFAENKSEEFKQRLSFPKDHNFGVAVLVGYASAPAAPHEHDGTKLCFVE